MLRSYFRLPIIVALSLLAVAASRADAQGQPGPNPNLKPLYGAAQLDAGAAPIVREVQAGGSIRTNLGGVKSFVGKGPDFSVEYRGKAPLIISAKSVGDTTLLVNLPDGSWVADDDSGEGLDPLLRFPNPQAGRYDIFVGTYQKDLIAATLRIQAGGTAAPDVAKTPPPPYNPNLPECFIVSAGVDDYVHANKLKGCLNDARNTVTAFRQQTGLMFRKVNEQILLDNQAQRNTIYAHFQSFTQKGAPGDTMVLFLSGHGARTNGNRGDTWFYLPADFNPKNFLKTALTDKQILDVADQIASQRKNVVIIVDACFCGQLAVTGQPYLQKHRNANQGGIVLMLSSAANETSTALGNYSAYAKAFADTMTGAGDLDKDSKIELWEIEKYSYKRTADLLVQARTSAKQNSIVTWSPSLSKDQPLGLTSKQPVMVAAKSTPPEERGQRWIGAETLPGYGKLEFILYANGKVTMIDARDTSEGSWRREDNQIRLAFSNGAVVYSGTVNGATISGTASSPSPRQETPQSWTWSVKQQQ